MEDALGLARTHARFRYSLFASVEVTAYQFTPGSRFSVEWLLLLVSVQHQTTANLKLFVPVMCRDFKLTDGS